MNVGDVFEARFEVGSDVHQGFIALFNDRNPLHTDRDFARTKGFEFEVMHGNILGGFLSYFIGECLPTKDVIIHWQEMKFLKPVYLGDQLVLTAEIAEFHESVRAVMFKFTFKKKDGTGLGDIPVAKGKIQIGVI